MSQYILAIIFFLLYIIVYYIFGVATAKIFKLQNHPIHELIYGMFIYAILFFVYVMPLKFKLVPVDTIGVIWAVFVLIVCLTIVIVLRDFIKESLKEWVINLKLNWGGAIVVALFAVVFITFIEMYGRLGYGFNQVWFVGWPSNSVFYNELMTHDTETGLPLTVFNNDRYLCTFLDHSAIVCKISGMHVMVEVRTVLTALFVLMQILIVWELAKYISANNQKKSLFVFFAYWTVRNMIVGSQLLPSYYTIFRTYEGKGFVMNVSYPLIILLLWKMYDTPEDLGWMWKSSLVLIGSMTYSLSMMFSAPFIFASFTPFLLIKKDKRLFRNLFVLFIISSIYFVVYYLGRKGTIDLTIHRME